MPELSSMLDTPLITNIIITTCEMKQTYHIVDTVDSEDDKNDEEYWTGSLLQVGL